MALWPSTAPAAAGLDLVPYAEKIAGAIEAYQVRLRFDVGFDWLLSSAGVISVQRGDGAAGVKERT
jgi:hypothetical protein